MFSSLNTFALDCSINTDSNNDGKYEEVVANVVNVQANDLIIVLKDGSVQRQKNVNIGSQKSFTLTNNKLKTFEGSRVVSFGTGTSNVIVTAKHISGTQAEFQSLSATAFSPSSPYGILLDYTIKFMITCL
jgi:hypothetical protein